MTDGFSNSGMVPAPANASWVRYSESACSFGLSPVNPPTAGHGQFTAVRQRHLGTSPMGYLRRVRLDHAHQDLTRSSPGDGLTVTAVAYRWGFRSSSRFAAAYRRAYGVAPSYTLNHD